ncbi:MAG: FAD-dependent oxidoreductase [Caulobacter sp.]|nr:FAD-dependent oxidoreductase [Caulobacter sp.]
MSEKLDVVIIGAGPSGAAAAAFLRQKGRSVEVIEKTHFPRFSIGESLLAQSVAILDDAGLLPAVEAGGFQFKNGAAFQLGDDYKDIYFPDKSAEGPGTTYQVMRSKFDKILADAAADMGAKVVYGEEVTAFESDEDGVRLTVRNEAGEERVIEARFCLDGSGFGRTLSRLLDLEEPSSFPPRQGVFCQVRDNIDDPDFDRNKILVSIHPEQRDVWYWLIPLADGITSMGVVGSPEVIEAAGATEQERLDAMVSRASRMAEILKNAEPYRAPGTIRGYSCSVKSLFGPSYALLGNAAEFLDPVFSSGVTIALKSAQLATGLIDRQLNGETVDWQKEFSDELYVGIETFRACVATWYDESLQRIIFNKPREANDITRYLTSILAGYAWDRSNPIVQNPVKYLRTVDNFLTATSE